MDDDQAILTQQIKAANDIVEVVGSYIALQPVGPTFKGICPFHEDNRPSFDVDPRRQRYRCWACNKFGDVFNFVQDFERLSFHEARELLARRAGITLKNQEKLKHGPDRARMLEVLKWADEQFQHCLLDSPIAEQARIYLGERKLIGETIRKFGLGFAPPRGDWLAARASQAGLSLQLMHEAGLVLERREGTGWFDRFRDRVMFPIRDFRGRTIGFGGRILPSNPKSQESAKYINTPETVLFNKRKILYGLDQARDAAIKAEQLNIVEGYTDVMMAHQMGVANVVATMGTALTEHHVPHLRRIVPRVVLVFDADAGGETGVDRALRVFVQHDLNLKVVTLPDGLDPCDMLQQRGAEAFADALTKSRDVLEFKLEQIWRTVSGESLDEKTRGVDQLLEILALAPDANSVKQDLMINRIAHRLQIPERSVRSRLMEWRARRKEPANKPKEEHEQQQEVRHAPASRYERELVEILLADSQLVAAAKSEIAADRIEHPGLRVLVENLYQLDEEGRTPDLDQLRLRIDHPTLLSKAFEWQERGRSIADRRACLDQVVARFRERDRQRRKVPLHHELQNKKPGDLQDAIAILQQIQNQSGG